MHQCSVNAKIEGKLLGSQYKTKMFPILIAITAATIFIKQLLSKPDKTFQLNLKLKTADWRLLMM